MIEYIRYFIIGFASLLSLILFLTTVVCMFSSDNGKIGKAFSIFGWIITAILFITLFGWMLQA